MRHDYIAERLKTTNNLTEFGCYCVFRTAYPLGFIPNDHCIYIYAVTIPAGAFTIKFTTDSRATYICLHAIARDRQMEAKAARCRFYCASFYYYYDGQEFGLFLSPKKASCVFVASDRCVMHFIIAIVSSIGDEIEANKTSMACLGRSDIWNSCTCWFLAK